MRWKALDKLFPTRQVRTREIRTVRRHFLVGVDVDRLIGTLHAVFMQAHLAVLDGIYKVSMSTKFHKKRTDFDPVMILFRFFLAG